MLLAPRNRCVLPLETERTRGTQVLASLSLPFWLNDLGSFNQATQRPEEPKWNPQLCSPFVSLSQQRTGSGTGGRAMLAKVGGAPHGSGVISFQSGTWNH